MGSFVGDHIWVSYELTFDTSIEAKKSNMLLHLTKLISKRMSAKSPKYIRILNSVVHLFFRLNCL